MECRAVRRREEPIQSARSADNARQARQQAYVLPWSFRVPENPQYQSLGSRLPPSPPDRRSENGRQDR